MDNSAQAPAPRKIGWDVFLLALLLFAVLNVTGLAEAAALPHRVQDVLHHPLLSKMLPAAGMAAFGEVGPRPGDPVGLLLNALALACLLGYGLVDMGLRGRWQIRLKWLLLAGIVLAALFLPTAKLVLLRQGSGPASYAHDGGVIQTEATIQFLLAGKNPYVEDYVHTPMAEWGFSEYRTALYHYPYLPWTFIFSTPFYLLGELTGFFDQRLVYAVLMIFALIAASALVRNSRVKLALVGCLALNPVMALDFIFGQNDAFVLGWLLLSLASWSRWRRQQGEGQQSRGWLWLSAALFGLACASKPTAWFFAPFYGLLLLQGDSRLREDRWRDLWAAIPAVLTRAWPALAVFALLLLPYIFWDPAAFYDDVWRWSAGQGETGYQIWGWGGSNFVLGFGFVADRFSEWPFWITELLIATPLLLWFMRRQQRQNTLANATWHYGFLLLAFFYASRFLNENYLGYILAFLAIGLLSQVDESHGYDDAASISAPYSSSEPSASPPPKRSDSVRYV
ncbi:MAG: DUF2029 domain-containing protein [Caldilineaceae bacterium]|nr:DUF2029 domain-containing protein [Caldilineaceae bacterium]